jgi:hypothetical protein
VTTPAPITKVLARGAWGTVECAVRKSGDAPAEEFLRTLSDEARARFMVLFQHMANYGKVAPKRFKAEMKKLSVFRHEIENRQLRFPCFQDGKRWIITHGFVKPGAKKKKGKWPQTDVERAIAIRDEYWERKKQAEAARNKQ